jgi:hypothetical protein
MKQLALQLEVLDKLVGLLFGVFCVVSLVFCFRFNFAIGAAYVSAGALLSCRFCLFLPSTQIAV